jgi:hypothetical protein
MKFPSERSAVSLALIAFTGLGVATLILVLAPSWTRLDEYNSLEISSPRLFFPEPVHQSTPGDLAMIVKYPLFNADRKEDPPEASSQAKLKLPALAGYRLAGVIIAGNTSIAMVERRATRAVVTLRIGTDLDGRTVKDITVAGVTLSSSSGLETLAIPKAKGTDFVSKNTTKAGTGVLNDVSNGNKYGNGGAN